MTPSEPNFTVKHRWHAAGEVALDKLADYLSNDSNSATGDRGAAPAKADGKA